MEKRPQELMRWFSPTTQKILDVCVRLQEDFGNPRQPATDYSQYQEHYGYTILRYGKDYEAQRELRIRTIHAFFQRHKITAMEREEGKSTCIITEITDDQDTPWYYRLIPCCAGTQKPKVKKPKRKKKSPAGSGLFGRIRKFFCRR
uniref:Uncharacterized protein n=1 Tax=Magallana gigas TaxID=29159 RepID=A0A8W8MLK4_MAGGI